jgi:hypothetical protein
MRDPVSRLWASANPIVIQSMKTALVVDLVSRLYFI